MNFTEHSLMVRSYLLASNFNRWNVFSKTHERTNKNGNCAIYSLHKLSDRWGFKYIFMISNFVTLLLFDFNIQQGCSVQTVITVTESTQFENKFFNFSGHSLVVSSYLYASNFDRWKVCDFKNRGKYLWNAKLHFCRWMGVTVH